MPGARKTRNTRRENRLEELGRVDAEHAHTSEGKRNLRDEKYRIRHELKDGGMTRAAEKSADTFIEQVGGSEKGKPHSTKEGRIASGTRRIKRFLQSRRGKPVKPKGAYRDPYQRQTPLTPKNMPGKRPQSLKKGGKVKNGLSPAQSHYLQHGYGPHKRDRKAEGGKPHSTSEGREAATRRKVKRLFQRVNPNLDKIKRMGTPTPTPGPKAPGNTSRRRVPAAFGGAIKAAKTMAAPGTHIRNVASGIKHGATKLIKGLPKIAKRGWK